MITPEQLAKSGSEDAHQAAIFCWAALNVGTYPALRWLFAIPNGGSRGDTDKSRKIAGARLKATGVKSGVYDMMLPYRRGEYSGLFIELKRPELKPKKTDAKGGRSDEQIEFGAYVDSQGYANAVAYGWQEAVAMIENYLNYSA